MLQRHPVKFANQLVEAAEIKKGCIKRLQLKQQNVKPFETGS
jgi:hypothetical protein